MSEQKDLETRILEIREWANSNYSGGRPHIPADVPSWTRDLLEALDIETDRVKKANEIIDNLLPIIKGAQAILEVHLRDSNSPIISYTNEPV